ncbi:hypothetical protein [Geminisphaera colitermitum]|nr:hypothetical protein [Geminisphaera colitermitum]
MPLPPPPPPASTFRHFDVGCWMFDVGCSARSTAAAGPPPGPNSAV